MRQLSLFPAPPVLLTVREYAERFGVPERTVRRRVALGELPAVVDGRIRRVAVDPDDLPPDWAHPSIERLTVREYAERAGVCTRTARRHVVGGAVASVLVQGRRLVLLPPGHPLRVAEAPGRGGAVADSDGAVRKASRKRVRR